MVCSHANTLHLVAQAPGKLNCEGASQPQQELLSLKRAFSKLPSGAILNRRDSAERLGPLKKGVRWLSVAFESKNEEVSTLDKQKGRLHGFQLLLQSPH